MFTIAQDPNVNNVVLSNREPTASSAMQPMIDEEIHIVSGSALDFSSYRETATPAGSNGRIIVNTSNSSEFAEANDPTTTVLINIAQWAPDMSSVPLPSDKTVITNAVNYLARRGFNAFRIHGLEYWLMSGTSGEFNFPADRMDSFYFLLSELKRAGLFYIINPRANQLYQDGEGGGRFTMPAGAVDWKPRLFVQQNARDHWLTGFDLLYNQINPYTGINILLDPACFLVECMNECSSQFAASKAWPDVWITRDSAQGTAALTWHEWLATQYASISALNTQYSETYTAFTDVPSPPGIAFNTITATQICIDAVLYCYYLNQHIADFYGEVLGDMGYTGLISSMIDFASTQTLKSSVHNDMDVINIHGYPMLARSPTSTELSAPNAPVWGSTTNPGYSSWLFCSSAFADNKPAYIGEFGWPSWASYRNQYPFLAAYMALGGCNNVSCFHQGNFFEDRYDANADDRTKALFSYSSMADPVAGFTEVANLLAIKHVDEATYSQTILISDRYAGINLTGTSPRTAARVPRSVTNLFLPTQLIPAVIKLRMNYTTDNTNDDLAGVWNAKSWFTILDEIRAGGGIDTTNEAWISANANRGNITAVTVSGSVVGAYATVTASATQPVLTIGSHTLEDYDHIAISTLNGTVGVWPNIDKRGTRAYVKKVDTDKVQILSGLDLTGLSGFTAGTWCEFDNVNQSSNKQIYMSRRLKAGHIDTTKFKYFVHTGATLPWTKITNMTVTSLTTDAAFFVAALDDTAITSSSHLLIGMVGNTDNTGQTFADATRAVCTNFGTYPITMTDCTASIRLTLARPTDWKLYRLGRNGRRTVRETPTVIDIDAGTMDISLRSGSVQPCVFWEMVR
jgi:hypothetical protein